MDLIYYQIEEVAQKTGLTKRALRYYEDMKLVTPIRTDAGYRLYSDDDISEILRIRELRDSLGFSLNSIKESLDLQNTLKEILSQSNGDPIVIKKSIEEVEKQIKLISEKEIALSNVKNKYEVVLKQLVELLQRCE